MSAQTIIAVAGMHRSGTSMIARLLNLCGMDLGPQSDLMPPSPANPEGYWEHVWFNYCNDRILDHFHGAWDLVPTFPENWPAEDGIEWIRSKACEAIDTFKGAKVWGWKDPRTSLTLAFWKSLLPELKLVVCVRNPLDVARSLNKRGSTSLLYGLNLWWQYNSAILREEAHPHVITTFDRYFVDGSAELARLAGALGLKVSDEAIREASESCREGLRHSQTTLDELIRVCPWPGLVQTYCRLMVQSQDALNGHPEREQIEELAGEWTPDATAQVQPGTWDRAYQQLRQRLSGAEELIGRQLAACKQLEAEVAKRDEQIRLRDQFILAEQQREHPAQQACEAAQERLDANQGRSRRALRWLGFSERIKSD